METSSHGYPMITRVDKTADGFLIQRAELLEGGGFNIIEEVEIPREDVPGVIEQLTKKMDDAENGLTGPF